MMSSDTQFTALGPTIIGFQTSGTNIRVGAGIVGNEDGVRGTCGNALGEQGAGVLGTAGQFNGNGVIGIADTGDNAFGVWGLSATGFAGRFDGRVHVNGNFTVSGTKAAVVAFPDGSQRCLYAVESPESWFEDFGFGVIENGSAEIQLDSGFAAVVNDEPYHVFISEYDDNNTLFVASRTNTGFVVRAKSAPARCQFSYRVVARRKDIDNRRFCQVNLPAAKSEKRRELVATSPDTGRVAGQLEKKFARRELAAASSVGEGAGQTEKKFARREVPGVSAERTAAAETGKTFLRRELIDQGTAGNGNSARP
jgi:hypothetical protein